MKRQDCTQASLCCCCVKAAAAVLCLSGARGVWPRRRCSAMRHSRHHQRSARCYSSTCPPARIFPRLDRENQHPGRGGAGDDRPSLNTEGLCNKCLNLAPLFSSLQKSPRQHRPTTRAAAGGARLPAVAHHFACSQHSTPLTLVNGLHHLIPFVFVPFPYARCS